jgi:hypothetical protein
MGRIENLTSLDPGKNTGLARFKLQHLSSCNLVDPSWRYRRDPGIGEEWVVLEVPRIYLSGPAATKRPNDIVDLAIDAAMMVGDCPPEYLIKRYPADWKAQVDPDQLIERIKGFLTPRELHMAEGVCEIYGARGHNIWDSIGLGLFTLGRMGKGGR